MRPLNTLDIDVALKGNSVTKPFFDGVYASDEISRLTRKPNMIVVNTEPSWKKGEHWLVIYFTRQNTAEIFDSLATDSSEYPDELKRFISKFASSVKYSRKRVQPAYTSLCGHYCLHYANCRCKGNSMMSIIDNMPSPNWIKFCIPLMYSIGM